MTALGTLPPLRHAWLSKLSRKSLFIQGAQEHQARCVCGHVTPWTTSLRRADEAMALHVESHEGETIDMDLTPAGVELRRKLNAAAVERATRAQHEMLATQRVNRRKDRVLWFAIVFLIVAFGGAAIWLHFK